MTKKTRRRYTAEFKAAAVARLDERGETLSSVAQALGVAATQVKTWRLEQLAAGSAEAVARRKVEALELQQLRRDNKRLQEENEILRKASAMADHLRSSLCENALMMAIQHRAPPPGLLHHSDRGVQYACGPYRKILDRYGIKASMSRKGDCYDNAPMESFFSSMKTELVHRTQFRTRREAKAALFEYIEIFYNRKRRHSGIGYRTPAQAHAERLITAAA
jgi:putative transposase